jgi:hypothetical protein
MKNVAIDSSRADAGEAMKDIMTKGKGVKPHQVYEHKENYHVPEVATKAAAPTLPSWLISYIKAFKGQGMAKAKGRMGTDKTYTLLKPESTILRDALRESETAYHGEVAKTVGARALPVAGALGLGKVLYGGDENKG